MAIFSIVFDHSTLARATERSRDLQNDGQILLHKIFRADSFNKSNNKIASFVEIVIENRAFSLRK